LILNINIPKNLQQNSKLTEELSVQNAGVTIDQIRSLLSSMPDNTSYVITDINSIIAELFTNVGRGTYFKISKSILRFKNLKDVDLFKLKTMIESSFKKKLKYDYFEKLSKRNPLIFITENYSAAAIVTRELDNYAYLDKFCVDTHHQVIFFIIFYIKTIQKL
jgi:acetylglutamate synthase